MRFSDVLDTLTPAAAAGTFTATVGDDWLQGRSVFGGLQAALAVKAIRQIAPEAPLLRTLQTTFIAPVPAGTVRVEARVLRVGKSAIHAEARLFDGEQLACLVIAVFGAARPSAIAIELPAITASPLESARRLPYVAGIAPAFMQHMKLSWAQGAWPYCGGSEARTQVWVAIADEPVITEAVAIALADAIPSPALSTFRKPTVASSLTWTLEFLGQPLDVPQAPWLMDAEVNAGRDGYLAQTATLADQHGRPVALTRQSVVVFG